MNNQKQKIKTPHPTPILTTKTQKNKKNTSHFFKMSYGYILIALVGFGLYAQTMSYGYVDFDDKWYIVDNPHYFDKLSQVYKGFIHSITVEYYRPMLFAFFTIEYSIAKTDPFIYHFSNILFHLISCLLLFRFLCLLEYDRWISFWTTLVFTVHPLFVQGIAWIFGRNDPYLAIFILSGMISYIQYQKTSKRAYLFLHLFCYAACLFTKETGAALAVVCFFYSLLKVRKENPIILKNMVLFWAFITLTWFFIRRNALKEVTTLPHEAPVVETNNIIDSFMSNIPFVFESISKLVFPFHQSVYPSYSWATSLIGVGISFLLLGFVLYIKPKSHTVLWAIGWMLLFLLPPMLIRSTAMNLSDYLEHRTYVPALGFIVFLNELIHTKKNFFAVETKQDMLLPSKWIFLPIICIFTSTAYIHSKHFEDGRTFWKNATETSPNSPAALRGRGVWFYNLGKLDTAAIYMLQAFHLNPAEEANIETIGKDLEKKNKFHEALQCYKAILSANPNNVMYMLNVGSMYFQINKYDSSMYLFQKAVETNKNQKVSSVKIYNMNGIDAICTDAINCPPTETIPKGKYTIQVYGEKGEILARDTILKK